MTKTEQASELKPCPFCGGAATLYCKPLPLYPVWVVECSQRPIPHHTTAQKSEVDAVSDWNNRTAPTVSEAMRCPEVMALVEALRPFSQLVIRDGTQVVCDVDVLHVHAARAALQACDAHHD